MERAAKKPVSLVRRMSAALIVAIGVAIVWGLIVAWTESTVASWIPSPPTTYESVAVTRDGQPIIESHSAADYQDVTYRTLKGQSIEVKSEDTLSSASLLKKEQPPRFFAMPLGWGQSLAASDFARPRGGWYLVHNNELYGRAYFVGYDVFSDMPIGFLGREGFRRGLPPVEEWFDLGLSNGYSMGAVSAQHLPFNSPANQYDPGTVTANLPNWLVFVLDGDRLQEVDLRARTVREIFSAPELISLGLLMEAKSLEPEAAPAPGPLKWDYRLALRTNDRLFVLDPAAEIKREFSLPESLRAESFVVYSIGPDQLLLYWPSLDDLNARTEHLVWLEANGTISREETFQLGQRNGDFHPLRSALLLSSVAPIPLGWAAVGGVAVPIGTMNSNLDPTYAAALSRVVSMAWPGLLIVTAVGCCSAWLVWRWQRKYCRSGTGAWCTFAFLLGLPGLAAYWLEMSRAKLEPCDECHATVPRDRDACATCEVPFPAPSLVGTEIFN